VAALCPSVAISGPEHFSSFLKVGSGVDHL
jgi:hypothetical protein